MYELLHVCVYSVVQMCLLSHFPPLILHPSSHSSVAMALNLELNSDRYVSLLEKLIGESEFLQNNPPQFIPQEDRYWAVVLLCVYYCGGLLIYSSLYLLVNSDSDSVLVVDALHSSCVQQ